MLLLYGATLSRRDAAGRTALDGARDGDESELLADVILHLDSPTAMLPPRPPVLLRATDSTLVVDLTGGGVGESSGPAPPTIWRVQVCLDALSSQSSAIPTPLEAAGIASNSSTTARKWITTSLCTTDSEYCIRGLAASTAHRVRLAVLDGSGWGPYCEPSAVCMTGSSLRPAVAAATTNSGRLFRHWEEWNRSLDGMCAPLRRRPRVEETPADSRTPTIGRHPGKSAGGGGSSAQSAGPGGVMFWGVGPSSSSTTGSDAASGGQEEGEGGTSRDGGGDAGSRSASPPASPSASPGGSTLLHQRASSLDSANSADGGAEAFDSTVSPAAASSRTAGGVLGGGAAPRKLPRLRSLAGVPGAHTSKPAAAAAGGTSAKTSRCKGGATGREPLPPVTGFRVGGGGAHGSGTAATSTTSGEATSSSSTSSSTTAADRGAAERRRSISPPVVVNISPGEDSSYSPPACGVAAAAGNKGGDGAHASLLAMRQRLVEVKGEASALRAEVEQLKGATAALGGMNAASLQSLEAQLFKSLVAVRAALTGAAGK